MPRLILIDNNSGYIFGDHSSSERVSDDLLIDAARAQDEEIGEHGRTYNVLRRAPRDTSTGYHVYRSDVRGSDQISDIIDGQSQELIDAVERDCDYVGYVACLGAQD